MNMYEIFEKELITTRFFFSVFHCLVFFGMGFKLTENNKNLEHSELDRT